MICKKCGKEVDGQTQYCPFCGSDMADGVETASFFSATTQNATTFTAPGSAKQSGDAVKSVSKPTWAPPGSPLSKATPGTSQRPIPDVNIRAIIMVFAAIFGLTVLGIGGYFIYDRIHSSSVVPPVASTMPKLATPSQTPKSTPAPEYATISNSEITNIINSNVSGAQVGIYVKNLATGYTYGYNEKSVLPSSAMSYVPIMLSVSDYAKNHRTNLDSDGMTFNYMPNGMEKPNSKNDDGQYFSIRNYIETIVKYGDNNRSNALVDWIGNGDFKTGFSYINSLIQQRSYTSTSINRKIFAKEEYIDTTAAPNTTCAYDIANLFNDFLSNGYVGDRDYMRRICQYTDNKEQPQGIRKAFTGSNYSIANHYAINNLSQNEVASFSDGRKEVIIAVLCTLSDNNANTNIDEETRARMINQLFNYIVQSQLVH